MILIARLPGGTGGELARQGLYAEARVNYYHGIKAYLNKVGTESN